MKSYGASPRPGMCERQLVAVKSACAMRSSKCQRMGPLGFFRGQPHLRSIWRVYAWIRENLRS